MKVNIVVKPGSKKGPLVQPELLGGLLLYVREPALEGQANNAVIKLLAEYYGVAKTQINIVRGQTSTHKVVEIEQ